MNSLSLNQQAKMAIAALSMQAAGGDAAGGRRTIVDWYGEFIDWLKIDENAGDLPWMMKFSSGGDLWLCWAGTDSAQHVEALTSAWATPVADLWLGNLGRRMETVVAESLARFQTDFDSIGRFRNIYCTGFSWGGAIALAFAQWLSNNNLPSQARVVCIDVAAPRTEEYVRNASGNPFQRQRIIRAADVVCNLPGRADESSHLNAIAWALTNVSPSRWYHSVIGTRRENGNIIQAWDVPTAAPLMELNIGAWLVRYLGIQNQQHAIPAYASEWDTVDMSPIENPLMVRGGPEIPRPDAPPRNADADAVDDAQRELIEHQNAQMRGIKVNPAAKFFTVKREGKLFLLLAGGNFVGSYDRSRPARSAASKGNSMIRWLIQAAGLTPQGLADAMVDVFQTATSGDGSFRPAPLRM